MPHIACRLRKLILVQRYIEPQSVFEQNRIIERKSNDMRLSEGALKDRPRLILYRTCWLSPILKPMLLPLRCFSMPGN
jgi:hypothetical protein